MDIRFSNIIKNFFPKGKAWEFQSNFTSLINGMSDEFGRLYRDSTDFYNNFNIINSQELADVHALDYLIVKGLYDKSELQRIIVEYLNKDLSFKEIIEDFSNFTGINIMFLNLPLPLEFGTFEFGDEFGDATASEFMDLLIGFEDDVTCREWNKIRWLVEYLKPPYLRVRYDNKPIESVTDFDFGVIEFGESFGGELTSCEIIN